MQLPLKLVFNCNAGKMFVISVNSILYIYACVVYSIPRTNVSKVLGGTQSSRFIIYLSEYTIHIYLGQVSITCILYRCHHPMCET